MSTDENIKTLNQIFQTIFQKATAVESKNIL